MVDCARREFLEETEYRIEHMQFLCEILDAAPGFPTQNLTIYWTWYDGVQPITCHEGQALEFVHRTEVGHLAIPPSLLAAWDRALDCAGRN